MLASSSFFCVSRNCDNTHLNCVQNIVDAPLTFLELILQSGQNIVVTGLQFHKCIGKPVDFLIMEHTLDSQPNCGFFNPMLLHCLFITAQLPLLEVGQNVKDSLRYAIQTTSESANHQTVYAVTGWKKINGVWEFLMPGADDITVHLPGKMQGYRMEQKYDYLDAQVVSCLMQDSFAPDEILLPLLAL